MPRLTSKEDARDVFNYMKNERIGQTFRLYYAVRADFEASTGNDEKVPSILQRGKACPPVSASAAASEAAFLEFMVSPSTCCECHPTTSQQQQPRGLAQMHQPQQTPLRTPLSKAAGGGLGDVPLSGNVSTRKRGGGQRRPPVKRLGLASLGLGERGAPDLHAGFRIGRPADMVAACSLHPPIHRILPFIQSRPIRQLHARKKLGAS